MDFGDQVPPAAIPDPADGPTPIGPPTAHEWPPYEPRLPDPPRPGERGLRVWFAIVLIAGVAGVLLRQVELAALAMLGGLFAVAQARDLDYRWSGLYEALQWLAPVGAGAVFFTTSAALVSVDEPSALHLVVAAFSVASGAACVALIYPPWADRLSRWWFRGSTPSHTLRLATRLVLAGILLAPPGWLLFQSYRDLLFTDQSLVGTGELWGGLIGLILVSLGGIGFMVRRGAKEAADRLGLAPFAPRDLIVVVLGVTALYGVNLGFERMQMAWFPSAYASDQEVTGMIAGDLTGVEALLLGLSAGIGEEIALRGALLPRLGLFWTSVLFSALHVQYSWFGMLAILGLGLVLGFIRQRTSTTTAMAVHAAYDILAVLSAQQSVT